MQRKLVTFCLLLVGLLMVCGPLFAHHGAVAYDETKVVVLKQATVTKFLWENPHNLILFDVTDEKGKVVHWAAEGGSPSALTNLGWNRNSLRTGDVVTVYLCQAKLGTPVGRLNKVVRADGVQLKDSSYGGHPD